MKPVKFYLNGESHIHYSVTEASRISMLTDFYARLPSKGNVRIAQVFLRWQQLKHMTTVIRNSHYQHPCVLLGGSWRSIWGRCEQTYNYHKCINSGIIYQKLLREIFLHVNRWLLPRPLSLVSFDKCLSCDQTNARQVTEAFQQLSSCKLSGVSR